MINITNFSIEENYPLSIELDKNGEQLLTSGRSILEHGYAQNGGLAVNFDINVVEENIKRGFIALVQVCKYHLFNVWDINLNLIKNDLINQESGLVLDGMDSSSPLYKRHAIENNKLIAYTKFLNRYLYFDAPYVYLETEWNKVEYK